MRVLSAVVAIASGAIVLLGYFLPGQFDDLRNILVEWAVVIAAMSVLVGFGNLVFVHMEKIRARQKNSFYGLVLIFSLITTFGLGLIFQPAHPFIRIAVDAVIVPVEASLLAILSVTLLYASIRLLRRRADMMSILFVASTILFLLAFMPTILGPVPFDQWILFGLGLFTSGGTRGLLIGIALGTLLTGIRVLFGIDRPYGGN